MKAVATKMKSERMNVNISSESEIPKKTPLGRLLNPGVSFLPINAAKRKMRAKASTTRTSSAPRFSLMEADFLPRIARSKAKAANTKMLDFRQLKIKGGL